MTERNWGYNCLTAGIHHGRPEPLWNLPLIQASVMYEVSGLRQIVVARIYNDAMQMVQAEVPGASQEWATQIKELATDRFVQTFASVLSEVQKFYSTDTYLSSIAGVIERVEADTLNARYDPLHSYDSVNLLCRILGTTCAREVSASMG